MSISQFTESDNIIL